MNKGKTMTYLTEREKHLMFDAHYATAQGRIDKPFTQWLKENEERLASEAPSTPTDFFNTCPCCGQTKLPRIGDE